MVMVLPQRLALTLTHGNVLVSCGGITVGSHSPRVPRSFRGLGLMCPSRATVLAYRPALDGVRGISIIGVMAFHSGLAPGGWLGVDAFFTLSGFLITTLLLDESHTTGGIELRRFYWRRFL